MSQNIQTQLGVYIVLDSFKLKLLFLVPFDLANYFMG